MLWIEKYRPRELGEVAGQGRVVRHLARFAAERSVPHLLVTGPHGTGKSAAVGCLAKALYGDAWEGNTTVLDATTLFRQGKGSLAADERFAHLFRRDESLATNFKRIVREYASMRPLGAEFKLMVIEGAHSLPREIQQALRRTLERYSATCRFILVTTNQSAIIPAIGSRCLPLAFSPVDGAVVLATLERILDAEAPGRRKDLGEEVEMIVHASAGDLRRATMLLQILVESGKGAGEAGVAGSETGAVALQLVRSMRAGDFGHAQQAGESLLIDYGLSGREAIREIGQAVKQEYNDPRIAAILGEADSALDRAGNEFVQVNALIARVIGEVFS
ncbi:MAG TPA: AAA family ATPase [Methanomicrobiales archaeon]|nr:AAA family ATPase [Methanomicrobiales archaeon]